MGKKRKKKKKEAATPQPWTPSPGEERGGARFDGRGPAILANPRAKGIL